VSVDRLTLSHVPALRAVACLVEGDKEELTSHCPENSEVGPARPYASIASK